jgi:hypothetical protein
MAIHNVIWGRALFSTANRRNQVVNRWNTAATGNNFQGTSVIPNHGPGIVTYNHLYIADTNDPWIPATSKDQEPTLNPNPGKNVEPGMVDGQSYPAFHMAFSHADYAMVEQAAIAVADEMNRQGWLLGWFGTGRIGTYL